MSNPKEEALIITKEVLDDLGSLRRKDGPAVKVDGWSAIPYMKEKGWPFREMEWSAYYTKYRSIELCSFLDPDAFKMVEPDKKKAPRLRLLKGKFLWDFRFSALKENLDPSELANMPQREISLNDVGITNAFLKKHKGLGVFVFDACCDFDVKEGTFKQWHDEFKGGPTDYVLEIESDADRPSRIRKTSFIIRRIFAFYFPEKAFVTGVEEGWLTDQFQEDFRQPDGTKRKGKYCLYFDKIPDKYKLFVRNFNHDRDDFAEFHGDPFIGSF